MENEEKLCQKCLGKGVAAVPVSPLSFLPISMLMKLGLHHITRPVVTKCYFCSRTDEEVEKNWLDYPIRSVSDWNG